MNWETDVEFCPDVGDLTIDSISELIANKVFKTKSFSGILKARYEQMQKYFNAEYNSPDWDLTFGGFTFRNIVDKKKKDARLKVSGDRISQNNENGPILDLFNECDFGHDLPVWVCKKGIDKKGCPHVMIVAQDPKRNNDERGYVYLSSPFGLHSRNFRKNLTTKIIDGLMEEGAIVYVTDYLKFYASHPGYIRSIDCFAKEHAEVISSDETSLFKPCVLVTLGKEAFTVLQPSAIDKNGCVGGKKFNEVVTEKRNGSYYPWRGEYVHGEKERKTWDHVACLHTSRVATKWRQQIGNEEAQLRYYVQGIMSVTKVKG